MNWDEAGGADSSCPLAFCHTSPAGVYTVTLIPGDGIGAEIAGAVKEVFEVLNVPVEWEQFNVSGETHGNESQFKEAMESLRRNKVGLKGE